MLVKYCNASCQKNHWATLKNSASSRAAELRDEALFKDPPAKEGCPICFLPMPLKLICCVSLPPATISSLPIYEFSIANEELSLEEMKLKAKSSGNSANCPYCKAEGMGKTKEESVQDEACGGK